MLVMAVLERDLRQRQALTSRRQLGHDAVALLFLHHAPARDLLERAGAAHADVALRIHDADLHARRLHAGLAARFAEIARFTLEAGVFFSTPQIHSPMPTSLSRSTPVSLPRPCSM